jgi:hypothetical protein
MNIYNTYALCISVGKIKVSPDKTIEKMNCDIFKTLEEADIEREKKNPLDFQIIKLYSKKPFNTHFKMNLTYSSN